MTTNVVECKDCAYGREANVPNAVFCMLNHQTFPIPVYGCSNGRPGRIVPQTNADRIRAMTDEELAEMCAGGCPNGDRLNCGKYYLHGGRDCFNCWLDWLKSPAEVDK